MGWQERKQQEKEIRRNDIIEAAEKVFFAKGYEKATMDEVAKEAEFSKRTVYVYFNSKEQLYFEIMIRGYRLLMEMLQTDLQESAAHNAIEELQQVFLIFYKFSNQQTNYFQAIMDYETDNLASVSGVQDQARNECYKLGEQILGYLIDVLRKGISEGNFRSDLDLKETALVLWACTIGVFNTVKKKEQYLIDFHQTKPGEFISAAFELLIRSITKSKGENP